MLTNDEARARVARGAAHLDRVRPGWFNEIDEGTLSLDHCGQCIVGQLCGDYYRDRKRLGFTELNVVEHGVALDPAPGPLGVQWRPLQEAWIEAIADRRFSPAARIAEAANAVREDDQSTHRPPARMTI